EYVGTEHILLSLCLPGTRGHTQLEKLGLNPQVLRGGIEAMTKPGYSNGGAILPYTSRAKKVLELAMDAARPVLSPAAGAAVPAGAIEVEYLLLGLLLETKGIAAQFLTKAGVTLDDVRKTLPRVRMVGFRVELSEASDASITDQIVIQIAEAIAIGGLQPGDRLATVRSLADSLDIAPGTVARAYGELERRGVVVTDGARGTTVAQRLTQLAPEASRMLSMVALFRPVAVEAFHLGATTAEVRAAIEQAIQGLKFEGGE
ncbi:MAG: Clp protease N-terminal domain-containing protein, partial [Gemmatimonadaceae bacterium]